MHPIKISGIGQTAFGELWDKSLSDLCQEAVEKALADAKIGIEDIDQVFVGNMLGGETSQQSHLGALIADLFGLSIPSVRIEGACASGGLAVYHAVQSLLSGQSKTVLVLGVEKMTDFCAEKIGSLLMQAAAEEERTAEATFPSLYALMAQAHMAEFGTSREQLALASVLAHHNALQNPLAQFQKKITVSDVLASASVADPLRLLDCSPITDGAAALILQKRDHTPVDNEACIIAQTCATDRLGLAERKTITGLKATQQSSQKIFAAANIKPNQVDIAEIHDCFSIAAIMAVEDIGFCQKGTGGQYIEDIVTGKKNSLSLNPSGGLKACGHPVGATGVKQIAEVALQLQGRAADRQQKNLKYGLTHNVGGTGATCTMHLLTNSLKDFHSR